MCVYNSATPWTIAHQAPLSKRFSRQEYQSGLPCPPPDDLPNPEIKPPSPALANRFFTPSTTWEALYISVKMNKRDPFILSPVSNVLLTYCYSSIKEQKHFQWQYVCQWRSFYFRYKCLRYLEFHSDYFFKHFKFYFF